MCEALEQPSRIDSLFIERAMIKVSENLRILAAEAALAEPQTIDTGAIDVLLYELRRKFAWVIVDLPRYVTPVHRVVLSTASRAILICERSLAGLRDTIPAADPLREQAPQTRLFLVESGAHGDRATVGKGEFEKAVGKSFDATLSYDPKAAGAAATCRLEAAADGRAAQRLLQGNPSAGPQLRRHPRRSEEASVRRHQPAMVSLFRKPPAEPDLDGRIAGLARRRGPASAQPAELQPEDSAPPSRRFAGLNGAPQPAPSALQSEPSLHIEAITATDAPLAEALPDPVQWQAPSPISSPFPLPGDEPNAEPEPFRPASVLFPQPKPEPADRRTVALRDQARQCAAAPRADSRAAPGRKCGGGAGVGRGRQHARREVLAAAKVALSTRLSSEILPERRSLLSRGELAKLVDAAVQAHFVRNAINADPLARRDLVTTILHELLNPGAPDPDALGHSPHNRTARWSRRRKRRSSRWCSSTWTSPPPRKCRGPPLRRS